MPILLSEDGRSDLGRWANLTTSGSFSKIQFWHMTRCADASEEAIMKYAVGGEMAQA